MLPVGQDRPHGPRIASFPAIAPPRRRGRGGLRRRSRHRPRPPYRGGPSCGRGERLSRQRRDGMNSGKGKDRHILPNDFEGNGPKASSQCGLLPYPRRQSPPRTARSLYRIPALGGAHVFILSSSGTWIRMLILKSSSFRWIGNPFSSAPTARFSRRRRKQGAGFIVGAHGGNKGGLVGDRFLQCGRSKQTVAIHRQMVTRYPWYCSR